MRIELVAVGVALLLSLSACTSNEGPVERAGRNVDEAVDNVKHGDLPFTQKGPMERAGENVDDAVDRATDKK